MKRSASVKSSTRSCIAVAVAIFWSIAAEGASVKSVNQKRRTVTVELDDSESFAKGSELCFFSDSDKKIDCGKVVGVSKKKGTVVVRLKSRRHLKKLTPGTQARSLDEGSELATTADATGKGYAGTKSPWRFWMLFAPGIVSPSKYNKLIYNPGNAATPTSLWAAETEIKAPSGSIILQGGIPLGSFSINPGFRYSLYQPTLIDSDYVTQVKNPFVATKQTASAFGVFADFQVFKLWVGKSFAFDFTSGLDIDMSTVELTAEKKTDDGSAIEGEQIVASATSDLTVISLRLGSGIDYMFTEMFGAHFGLNLLVPISESHKFSGSIPDSETKGVVDATNDLKNSLAHSKASLGIEASLGLTLAF